jgi:N-methylhydantoinase B
MAGVELEIFRHLFAACAEEMGVRLMRSAFSPNIKERLDFSCALFDGDGAMIAQAAHIPVHLGSTPMSVAAAIRACPSALARGEMVLLNDPYAGGTHLPDITLVAPCIVPGERRPRFYVANRAHHADVGGITPGSMPMSTHIDEEGIRISPCVLNDALVERICAASRTPDERRGDLRAQVAAARLGMRRLDQLCRRYGAQHVSDRAAALQDYSERRVRAELAALPDGVWCFEDMLDGDGFGAEDILISCVVTLSGGEAELDFRGCHDAVRGSVNAVRAITVSAVTYVLRCVLGDDIPANDGAMRPVRVLTRPGSVVDAQYPSAVAAGNVETSQRITDCVFGALAEVLPDRVPAASCGSMNNVTIGGEGFAYYETLAGGAGGGPEGPGGSAVHTHMTNTLNTPVEALEHAYPFRVLAYRIRTGSGGAGVHPGGDGLVRVYAFDAPAELTLLTERRRRGAWGLGGDDGAPGRNLLRRAGSVAEELPGKVSLRVAPGDVLEIHTPGGGGWSPRA